MTQNGNGEQEVRRQTESTYFKSNGVAGCDPLKLCAKLTFPPICRAWFWNPAPPIGIFPPNAQPDPLFANFVNEQCQPSRSCDRRLQLLNAGTKSYLASRLAAGSIPIVLVVEAVADRRNCQACL